MEINPVYVKPETVNRIKRELKKDFPCVQLQQFFVDSFYQKVKNQVAKLQFRRECIPTQYSCTQASVPRLLSASKELQEFFRMIGGQQMFTGSTLSFAWKDYTLLHDVEINPGIELLIDLTENWEDSWGGYVTYADGKGNFRKVPSQQNTILIADKQTIKRFIAYVNHFAERKKHLFILFSSQKSL